MDDLANILTLEIKREIASRYFGFRSWFEKESAAYSAQLQASQAIQESRLQTASAALYTIKELLATKTLYSSFLELTGLTTGEETIRQQGEEGQQAAATAVLGALFQGLPLGRKIRHKRLLLATYQGLFQVFCNYQDLWNDLCLRHNELAFESKKFYRNNDIGSILDFIRGLDVMDSAHQSMQAAPLPGQGAGLAQDLHLPLPPHPSTRTPELVVLPAPKAIKSQLASLAAAGFPQCLKKKSDLPP